MEQPNHSYIDQLSAGNKAFKEKLLAVIKDEFPGEKEIYLKNLEANNYKEASENVHKIKHKISILGLEKSYEIARSFEKNLKENDLTLKDEFETILNAISKYLLTI